MAKLGTLIAAAAAAFLLAACAQQYEAEAPTVGWTCLPGFGLCSYGGHDQQTNATVGLPFKLELRAGCNTGQWNLAGVEIETGRLPPGLEYDPAQYAIVGVPTRAGSFSFQALFRGISCPGSNYLPYGDWSGQYTIVATGS